MSNDARKPQAFRIEPPAAEPSSSPAPDTKRAAAQRKPQSFRLKDKVSSAPHIEIAPLPPDDLPIAAPMAEANAKRLGTGWGRLLIGSSVSLVVLWLGLTFTNMIAGFFAWSLTFGWISVAIVGLIALSLFMIVAREIWGIMRLRRIEQIQLAAASASQGNAAAARMVATGLQSIYGARHDLSWAMQEWKAHEGDIIDPPARVRLAERLLVEPLDEQAHRIIARRAKRVTLLSTVTPTAALDVLLVGGQNLFMIRELAELYGGKPSFFATLKLARMAATHLAVTAGLALSENALHLFVGKGLLGRISARFGEGAINGILTARIGLAARDVCRPIAAQTTKREDLTSLIKEISGFGVEN